MGRVVDVVVVVVLVVVVAVLGSCKVFLRHLAMTPYKAYAVLTRRRDETPPGGA